MGEAEAQSSSSSQPTSSGSTSQVQASPAPTSPQDRPLPSKGTEGMLSAGTAAASDDAKELERVKGRIQALEKLGELSEGQSTLLAQYLAKEARLEGKHQQGDSVFYSEFLAKQLDIHGRYEQLVLYGTILGGGVYLGNSLYRANLIMKASRESDPAKAKELRLMAEATMDQVEAAAMWSRRFKARGLAAAILAPVTWMAYVAMKHSTPSKSGRM